MENLVFAILPKTPKTRLGRCVWTLALVAAFTFLHAQLAVPLEGKPFLIYFFPVFLASILFDRGSGFLATIVSVLVADFLWIEPAYSFSVGDPQEYFGIAIFTLAGFCVASLTEALRKSLEITVQKEREHALLVRELNHRAMNDLQIVSSMLRVAARRGNDPIAALKSAAGRIDVMSRVYGQLQPADRSSTINLCEFVEGLMHDVRAALSAVKPVAIEVEVQPIQVSVRCATNLGLILNELITNALKHAFGDDGTGTITIVGRLEGGTVVLSVANDGGTAPLVDTAGTTLGTALVRQLAGKHSGTAVWQPASERGGMRVEVRLEKSCLPERRAA